jgi:hypothetical protein
MENLTNLDYSIILCGIILLCLNTLLQFRLGFKYGAKGGYTIGMFHAVSYFMKLNAIVAENPVSKQIVKPADIVVMILKSKTLDQFQLSDPDDILKIAQAANEVMR